MAACCHLKSDPYGWRSRRICFTRRAKGALRMRRWVDFWYKRISLSATVPGLWRLGVNCFLTCARPLSSVRTGVFFALESYIIYGQQHKHEIMCAIRRLYLEDWWPTKLTSAVLGMVTALISVWGDVTIRCEGSSMYRHYSIFIHSADLSRPIKLQL